MHFKQNNFSKVPKKLTVKLNKIQNNNLIVGSEITLKKNNLDIYPFTELPKLDNLHIGVPTTFLPKITQGKYSKRNTLGRTIKLKNIDKIEKSWAIEGPNFGDYSNGTHIAIITKLIWQTKTEFPKNLSITMIPITISDEQVTIRIQIDAPLNKNSKTFYEDLLFFINLLNENIHDVDILSVNEEENANLALETETVDWELLPIGDRDLKTILRTKFGKNFHNNSKNDDSISFFSNLKLPIDHYISGTGSFERYFGMCFQNGVVVLEDFHYGNATYVFNKNWEELSKMSRTELMHLNSSDIERITHNRNWKVRLNYIINSSSQS